MKFAMKTTSTSWRRQALLGVWGQCLPSLLIITALFLAGCQQHKVAKPSPVKQVDQTTAWDWHFTAGGDEADDPYNSSYASYTSNGDWITIHCTPGHHICTQSQSLSSNCYARGWNCGQNHNSQRTANRSLKAPESVKSAPTLVSFPNFVSVDPYDDDNTLTRGWDDGE